MQSSIGGNQTSSEIFFARECTMRQNFLKWT